MAGEMEKTFRPSRILARRPSSSSHAWDEEIRRRRRRRRSKRGRPEKVKPFYDLRRRYSNYPGVFLAFFEASSSLLARRKFA